MSRFGYWKVSAVFIFVTIVSNLDLLIPIGMMCASGGASGHCGG